MKDLDFLKTRLIAHRGFHTKDIIENTLPAFVKSVDKKYSIELDIHILIDKTIVVYHDYDLKRLTGKNKIIETLNYPELSKIKVKKKYTIPTLEQVMNIVSGKVPILIEIKDLDNNKSFYELVANMLDKYNGKFAIHSMNPKAIEWFYKNRPNYIVGLIIYNELNYDILKKYIKNIDFISVYKKQLPFKTKLFTLGWTIKNKKEYEKYRDLCDNLIVENII